MLLRKCSSYSGKMHSMELPVTHEEVLVWYQSGKDIKDVLPTLSVDQAEFLMTGITPQERQEKWSKALNKALKPL
jgi:hypothetical protein